jgi:polyhydroxyalkanoate synthase
MDNHADLSRQQIPKWKHFLDIWNQPLPESELTKKEAVWKKNKATLWHYSPTVRKYQVPVFLVYSLINKPMILDLAPGMSMIEAFVNEGYDVYLLDFGIPGYEDGAITIDDYVLAYIQNGVKRALRHSGAKEITIIGFCLGGTLAAMYAAIADEPIKNLILPVVPVDFSYLPHFDQWVKAIQQGNSDWDDVIDAYQTIPANMMKFGMTLITSPLYFSTYLSLLNRADDTEYVKKWRLFNEWANSHIPFSGAALKQLTTDFVIHNKLIKGHMRIKGKKVLLDNISANVLVVAGEHDQLVPKEMIQPIMKKIKSRYSTYLLLNSGHTSDFSSGTIPTYLKDWLPRRSNPITNHLEK